MVWTYACICFLNQSVLLIVCLVFFEILEPHKNVSLTSEAHLLIIISLHICWLSKCMMQLQNPSKRYLLASPPTSLSPLQAVGSINLRTLAQDWVTNSFDGLNQLANDR